MCCFFSAVRQELLFNGLISKMLNYIGQNTLVYYVFQFKAIRFVEIIFVLVDLSLGGIYMECRRQYIGMLDFNISCVYSKKILPMDFEKMV